MKWEGRCGVDAGNIGIFDMDKFKIKEDRINHCGHKLEVDPGVYDVKVHIPIPGDADIKRNAKLKTGGNLYIGDGCYVADVDNDNDPMIKDTNWFSKDADGAICNTTAADGGFFVALELTKVKEPTCHT